MPRPKKSGRPRKSWKESGNIEVWKRKGQPQPRRRVYRNIFGRFVSHHYIRKYNRGATAKRKWAYRELTPTGTHVSVIGITTTGEQKRWELYKGARTPSWEWQNAVGLAKEHPPKQHERHIYVRDMDFDEFQGKWAREPEVKSP